jgi:deazaflavin-dependent oxidoreductase (nitroreductase family)
LLLTHKGRLTGKKRQAVLEIIHADPESGQYTVVSGFGTGSQWYQNLINDPQVTIQVGKKVLQATARQLDPESASETMFDYAQKHPGSLKALASMLGYEIEFTPAGYRQFGRRIPVIRFYPRGGTESGV